MKIFIFFILIIVYSYGFDMQQIDQKIKALQSASTKERVALMNEIKKEIAAMNALEREKAINQLQHKLHKNIMKQKSSHISDHIMQLHEQSHYHRQQAQYFQQSHAAEQYIHQHNLQVEKKLPLSTPLHQNQQRQRDR